MIVDRNKEASGAVRFLEFFLTRNIGTAVDCGILWVLADCVFNGSYVGTNIVSPTISFEVATFVNYLTSYYLIYNTRIHDHGKSAFLRRFVKFNVSSIVGFLLKMVFLLLFEHWTGWHVVICNLLALTLSGMFNYSFAELWVFGKPSSRPKREVLSKEELGEMLPLFKGKWGQHFAGVILKWCGVDAINRLYDSAADNEGVSFASSLLDEIGCDYLIGNAERLENLPEGAFITISNHPYGGLDGIVLVDVIGRRRPDYKVMANDILSRVKALSSSFIAVNALGEKKDVATPTLSGARNVFTQLRDGHPIGLFPSGAVSDLHIKEHEISDREWQDSLIRLIQEAKAPVVPIRFFDRNSNFFYALGLVSWKIRVVRLPREILNKGKGEHRLAIGNTIPVEELAKYTDMESLRTFLRASVYDMPLPESFVHNSELNNG